MWMQRVLQQVHSWGCCTCRPDPWFTMPVAWAVLLPPLNPSESRQRRIAARRSPVRLRRGRHPVRAHHGGHRGCFCCRQGEDTVSPPPLLPGLGVQSTFAGQGPSWALEIAPPCPPPAPLPPCPPCLPVPVSPPLRCTPQALHCTGCQPAAAAACSCRYQECQRGG